MKQEKEDFIKKFKKHEIKQTDEDFKKATEGKNTAHINVISMEKKRQRDSDDDVEELEKKIKKKDKKDKRHKH